MINGSIPRIMVSANEVHSLIVNIMYFIDFIFNIVFKNKLMTEVKIFPSNYHDC